LSKQVDLMEIMSVKAIKVQATASDKEDAIRQAGQLLVDGGYVQEAYIDGMVAREKTMSTHIGYGICIPHAEYDDRQYILQTGLSVLQIPDGVLWEDDQKAYLLIGIAAKSDEHLGVLSTLAEIIEDEEQTKQLFTLTDPEELLQHLLNQQT